MGTRSGLVRVASKLLGGLAPVVVPPLLALQRLFRRGVVVLYHRVGPGPDPSYPPLPTGWFDAHLRFLTRHYRVVRLSELLDRHRRGESLAGLCSVTFDDGFRDSLEHAYPVLARHRVPVTHFLVAECLATGFPTWNYRLNRALTYGVSGRGPAAVSSRELLRVTAEVGTLSPADRVSWVEEHERGLTGAPPLPPMLRPDDLARFDPELVEWGSHGLTHASLGLCDAETAGRELSESRRRLGELLGAPPRWFSYPNSSYSTAVMEAAERCGYEAALAVDQWEVSPGASLYALPRFDLGGTAPSLLGVELTGAVTRLRRLRSSKAPALGPHTR
jgi:peptidoglycan/xylan/chitin deacetylase (PgdA/CDA1 family)